jgi:hypothetical protein
MTTKKRYAICTVFAMVLAVPAKAQDWKTEKRINLVFGLTQPLLLSGFNAEVNYIHNRFIFDYSHGVSLDFSGSSVTPDLKRQGVAIHMPYTTGFGAGYRFTEWLNIRVEPKWHRFECSYDDDITQAAGRITAFNTFSLGIGVYGHFRPFKRNHTFLNGILIAPSIRFWPTVSSTLKGTYTYYNQHTQTNEVIKTLHPGIGFSPIVFNVSIGYSFNLKKRQ